MSRVRPFIRRGFAALTALAVAAALLLLPGCMYPGNKNAQNPASFQEYIVVVQNAVDRYIDEKGVPPLVTKDASVSAYEKYPVDFRKLTDFNFLSSIPPNAFEQGGSSLYLVFDPETKARVKLMDLVTVQKAADLQKQIYAYARDNGQYPLGDRITGHYHEIDYDKLNRKPEQIRSVYSRTYLRFIMRDSGEVGIDYAPEIMIAIQKSDKRDFAPDYDLRMVLADSSFYVPAKSFPYYWQDGEPVLGEAQPAS